MKITAVDTAILRIPTRKPISLDFPIHSLVVAHVRTDEGVTGIERNPISLLTSTTGLRILKFWRDRSPLLAGARRRCRL